MHNSCYLGRIGIRYGLKTLTALRPVSPPRLGGAIILTTAMLLTGAPSLAAELAVGRESAVTGKQIMVPVKLKTENAAITALQFDVDYDAAVLSVSASLGPAAEKAGKRMTEGDPAKNRKRFMIFGLNHNLIEDGVVVELTIDIKAGAAGGEYALRCTSVVASTSTGARVEVRVVNGAVVVKNEP